MAADSVRIRFADRMSALFAPLELAYTLISLRQRMFYGGPPISLKMKAALAVLGECSRLYGAAHMTGEY